MAEEALPTIVLDVGSSELKCGFGGEAAPRKLVPTVLGWPRHPGVGGIMLGEKKDNFVGDKALERQGLLTLSEPVTRGVVTNWQDMEKVLHHAFYCELFVPPDEHPLLITEIPGSSRASREKLAEILFEVFNFPAVVVANQSCLGLFASGRSTGIVVDSGAGVTHVAPVWEGYTLPHYITSIDLAGSDLTSYLLGMLREKGYPFSTPKDRKIVEDIKSQVCYVCQDFEKELQSAKTSRSYERTYTMPDGWQISLVEDRFRCPEALFNPSLVKNSGKGIHELVNNTVLKCDPAVRKEMYCNVVLAGGSTLFPRLEDRLSKEVQNLASSQVKCMAFPERKFAAWLGGSLLASLPTFPCMWLAKKEYDDLGVSSIHKKTY
eukprot:Sspe_Gene.88120::Locus_60222_Transcript_1_1_Confidence_1.000_Length_1262::g.88120::m.88120/K05692/ACTB_G1; actin beta/gamma 1